MRCRARRLAARHATPPPASWRLARLLVAVLGLLGLLGVPVLPPAAAGPAPAATAVPTARGTAPDTPLEVTVESVTPSTLPQRPRARVVVTGRVANRSEETWSSLSVYLVGSTVPMRTSDELAAGLGSAPDASVGERIVQDGLYDEVGDLVPGGAAAYRLSVPRSALPVSEAGVYWLGVQVLGTAPDGSRDSIADARARTLATLMAGGGPSTTLALVVPFRAATGRAADGTLLHPERWEREVGPSGRMRRLLDQARSSGRVRTTWLLDPAVLDAIRSVASGDPPLDLTPTGRAAEQPTPDATGAPSPGNDQQDPGAGEDEGRGAGGQADPTAAEQAARSWLERFGRSLRGRRLATVPYGDMDVAAALRTGQDRMVAAAVQRSADEADRLTALATPVVAPPSGHLPGEALTFLPPGAHAVLGPGALAGASDTRVDLSTGATVVLTGADLEPGDQALAMRQRVLAEAAVHALGGRADQPLVLALPPQWDPGSRWRRARLFAGLVQPWLRTTDLPALLSTPAAAPPVAPAASVYSADEQSSEIPEQNFAAARRMSGSGDTLAGLLTMNDQVDDQVQRHALLSTSVWQRRTPLRARLRAEAGEAHVRSLLRLVRVRTQSFVTMSSDTGTFQVTLINGLDQMVTAGVRTVVADRRLTVEAPPPVRVPAGERRTIRIEARASDIGVHRVTVVPVNADGAPTGARTTFDVRSSNVGLIIWVIMGAGLVVLLVAVAVRVTRRVRRRRATPGPLLDRDPVGHR